MRIWTILFFFTLLVSCREETLKPRDRAPTAAASQETERAKTAVRTEDKEPPSEEPADAGRGDSNAPGNNAGFSPSGKPMLLDITRDNCLPCRIMAPWVEEIRKKYAGKADVVEINIDRPENRELEKYFEVRSVPTQIYLDAQGRVRLRHGGMSTLNEMQKVMEQLL
jgi:thioredoxin 1